MAGLKPAGVLMRNPRRGRRPGQPRAALRVGRKFGLEIITIEGLIRHRRRSEKLVYRLTEANLPSRSGAGRIIVYGVQYEDQQPIAIVMGDRRRGPSRWCGCTRPVSPATCWPRSAAIAATSFRWPWT